MDCAVVLLQPSDRSSPRFATRPWSLSTVHPPSPLPTSPLTGALTGEGRGGEKRPSPRSQVPGPRMRAYRDRHLMYLFPVRAGRRGLRRRPPRQPPPNRRIHPSRESSEGGHCLRLGSGESPAWRGVPTLAGPSCLSLAGRGWHTQSERRSTPQEDPHLGRRRLYHPAGRGVCIPTHLSEKAHAPRSLPLSYPAYWVQFSASVPTHT